jgi:hypothetical protein
MTARRTLLVVAVLFGIGEALDSIDVGLIGVISSAPSNSGGPIAEAAA